MLNVIYEDNQIVVVVKPHNQPTQEDESGDLDLLREVKEYIKVKYEKPGEAFIGLVHRLDRVTGGIMVFARTSKAAQRLSEQFKNHDNKKIYYAICESDNLKANEGILTDYLIKDEKNNIVKVTTQSEKGAKKAVLNYKILESSGSLHLVEVELLTGRSHQIRVQLSNINLPIYADNKYNKNATKGNIALWAGKLKFAHPVSKQTLNFMAMPDEKAQPWNKFYIGKYFVR